MSYPDPRYHGQQGEISAVCRRHDEKPELTIGSGTAVSYLATGASTHGQFGLYRWDAKPRTPGPAAHFHRTMSESFFILSGVIRLFDGERWIDGRAGDFLFVPEGGLHGFQNDSDGPASMLILFAPGAPREGYFEAIAARAAGQKFTDEEWKDICLQHDNYFI
ncbi:MAG TPA: cupin domain-containing protein [Nitrospira sp.]|jgi:quercetin dioxygenase-like cupin family protein|nr:cupin domain-containing protein [Nitrospira sp.]